ncbi:DUF167 domain-containing protein [Candidatus Gracilibacteria bacterium]|nr:DUF167 domain-containing protein [Candidatus Gracilibacteria bacterium]
MKLIHVQVKAHPRRPTIVVSADEKGNMVVSVAAERSEGKANRVLISLLSDYFKLAPTQIRIVKGHLSSLKTIALQSL